MLNNEQGISIFEVITYNFNLLGQAQLSVIQSKNQHGVEDHHNIMYFFRSVLFRKKPVLRPTFSFFKLISAVVIIHKFERI